MEGSTPISSGAEVSSPPEVEPGAEPVGPASAQTDLWIFRDGRRVVSGWELVSDLERRISRMSSAPQTLLDALIQAGQLESALADANSASAKLAGELTESLASSVCGGRTQIDHALQLVRAIEAPSRLAISPPEGFTYYALHPLDFANAISQIASEPAGCAVIGIRSIGTTLSAMCVAALRKSGREVSRMTVRPTGHPYARETEFSPSQMAWIHEQLKAQSQFLIVDEGPGRSGSTFLSVAEALLRAGVRKEQITIIGSRIPNATEMCAENAQQRWQQFRFVATMPCRDSRFQNFRYVGGGEWRRLVFGDSCLWPESWTQMERLKFLSPEGSALFKFEGMGPLGAAIRERAFVLGDARFSPQAKDAGDGFVEYEWFKRRQTVDRQNLSTAFLDHLAGYCAFRAREFSAPSCDAEELRHMVEFNVHTEFGTEISLPEEAFATQNPVLVDGRMQAYEWIAKDGSFLKTDAISHGDDHFFPGPCDIAWDLAGIATEWNLDRSAREYLTSAFKRITGKNIAGELTHYELAYSVFRMGFCKMGISTVRGCDEEPRLRAAYLRYRAQAQAIHKKIGSRNLKQTA